MFDEYVNPKDIRITQPNLDCKFCIVRNFVNMKGNKVDSQYAECINQKKTHGCVSIDIKLEINPLMWETSCRNCKLFISRNQLTLF